MKRLFFAILLSAVTAGAVPLGVTTNGVITAPTNFPAANGLATTGYVASAIASAGVGSGITSQDATNAAMGVVQAGTNLLAAANTNQWQPLGATTNVFNAIRINGAFDPVTLIAGADNELVVDSELLVGSSISFGGTLKGAGAWTIQSGSSALTNLANGSGSALWNTRVDGANVSNAVANATSANNSTNFWGQLSPTNYNNGTSASASTYLRGDGTWATPATGGQSNDTVVIAGANVTVTTNGPTGWKTSYTIAASAGGGGIGASASVTNLLILGPFVDIRVFGAVGDGSTDNTVAISNANWTATQSNMWVFIPPGRYVATNLTATAPGWFGQGTNSCLVFGSTGAGIFITNRGKVSFKDFALDGGSTYWFASATNVLYDRIGISHDPSGESEISGMNIFGFNRSGIEVGGPVTLNRTQQAIYQNNWIHDCYNGFTNRAGAGEYCRALNNRIWNCFNGLSINAANWLVSGNIVSDCLNSAWWGVAADNRGHCKWIGNTFNHGLAATGITIMSNYTGGIFAENSLLGSGNSMFVQNCKGVNIYGNQFQSSTFAIDASGNANSKGVLFHDNIFTGNGSANGTGGITDWTSGAGFIHWNNYTDSGFLGDGTGAPWYAAGGYGATTNYQFRINSSAYIQGLAVATNGFAAGWSAGFNGSASGMTNLTASYATNSVTTGNGTITLDMNKPRALVWTNTACTIWLANVPTSGAASAKLIISNSAGSGAIMHTLAGFGALTNLNGGAWNPSSQIYITNLSAKSQVGWLEVECYGGGITNATWTQYWNP